MRTGSPSASHGRLRGLVGLFAIPVLFAVPEYRGPAASTAARSASSPPTRASSATSRGSGASSAPTVWFLLASAVFRDGLAGVFTFGGVLAASVFGFSAGEVIIFAIAPNVVAGVSTIAVGALDDRLGAKPVIVAASSASSISGLLVFFLRDGGQIVFWIAGIALCLFVGPAQAAIRTFLARIIPAGSRGRDLRPVRHDGRAMTFLAPLLFAIFVRVGGAAYYGILGIVLVLAIGSSC